MNIASVDNRIGDVRFAVLGRRTMSQDPKGVCLHDFHIVAEMLVRRLQPPLISISPWGENVNSLCYYHTKSYVGKQHYMP